MKDGATRSASSRRPGIERTLYWKRAEDGNSSRAPHPVPLHDYEIAFERLHKRRPEQDGRVERLDEDLLTHEADSGRACV